MTAKEAKEKTLYFWRYIAAHPEIEKKLDLPEEMYQELMEYDNKCPLCSYADSIRRDYTNRCSYCVLETCCFGSVYSNWTDAKTNEERQQHANELVAKVEAWEV
jgi:hypothetical protein